MTIEPTRAHPGCANMKDKLADFADGECAPADEAVLREHLRTCAACLQEVRELTALNQALRDLGEEPAPNHLFSKVQAGIDASHGIASERQEPPRWSRGGIWSDRRVATIAGLCVIAALAVIVAPRRGDIPLHVVAAPVQDFMTYRASGRPLDFTARDRGSLAEWAQPRITFALPELEQRIGAFEIAGVRLCWLLERRLVGVSYVNGDDRAVVYVMERGGLVLPAADRHLANGVAASIHHHKGHGVAVWSQDDLVFVLVAAEKDFDAIFPVASTAVRGKGMAAIPTGPPGWRLARQPRRLPSPSTPTLRPVRDPVRSDRRDLPRARWKGQRCQT